jgi:predicted alpha/beta superfamily hydrolase
MHWQRNAGEEMSTRPPIHAWRFRAYVLGPLVAAMLISSSIAPTRAMGTDTPSRDAGSKESAPVDNRRLLRARTRSESTLISKQGRPYRILISCPEGPEPPGGLPVIYILDGDAWFGIAVEIARMREYETLAPALIVAVGYPSHFFFDAGARTFDFTPPNSNTSDPQLEGMKVGGAGQFLSFLNETLKPWVRANYKINPSRQALFGHSYGGLFVLYAMFNAPESFDTYLAASPSIWFSEKAVLKGEGEFEANPARGKLRVLVTVGGLELPHRSVSLESDYRRYFTAHPEMIPGQTVEQAMRELFFPETKGSPRLDMIQDARALTERLAHDGVNGTYIVFEGEEHMSAGVSALNRGIPFALRP